MSMAKGFAHALPLALIAGAALAADTPGLGKPVSEADLAKWDMSVGPDGKNLPAGSGTPNVAAFTMEHCNAITSWGISTNGEVAHVYA